MVCDFPWFFAVWTSSIVWNYSCWCFSWVTKSRSCVLSPAEAVPREELWLGVKRRGLPPGAQLPPLPLALLALAVQWPRPKPGPQTPGPRGPQALTTAPRLPVLWPGHSAPEPHERAGSIWKLNPASPYSRTSALNPFAVHHIFNIRMLALFDAPYCQEAQTWRESPWPPLH